MSPGGKKMSMRNKCIGSEKQNTNEFCIHPTETDPESWMLREEVKKPEGRWQGEAAAWVHLPLSPGQRHVLRGWIRVADSLPLFQN